MITHIFFVIHQIQTQLMSVFTIYTHNDGNFGIVTIDEIRIRDDYGFVFITQYFCFDSGDNCTYKHIAN